MNERSGSGRDEDPETLRAFFGLCFQAVGPIPMLAPPMQEWFAAYHAEVADSLRAGQRDGSVRGDLDPVAESRDLLTYGAGLGFRWTLDPAGMDFVDEFHGWRRRLREAWNPDPPPRSR